MIDTSYYMIRAMDSSKKYLDIFTKDNIVAVGWSDVDFSKYKSIETLQQDIRSHYYPNNKQSSTVITKKLNEISRFYNMKIGCHVIVPYLNNSIIIGVIESDVMFNKDAYGDDICNRRKVTYLCNNNDKLIKIPRQQLSTALNKKLKTRGTTIIDLSQFSSELNEIFENHDNYSVPDGKLQLRAGGIQKINIKKYRKLKDIKFEFKMGVNLISGTNGTCKTSLLHIISNSYQGITSKCDWVDTSALSNIKGLTDLMNPKVERLTKGDKKYNDPAQGIEGVILNIDYENECSLGFRRHNSDKNNRYSLKPQYPANTLEKESLPYIPTIYLGLSRLYPFTEHEEDESISNISKNLPEEYLKELATLYKKFTQFDVKEQTNIQVAKIKKRADFSTNTEGIDSNTISSGEDNLMVILMSLISLKYYYETIKQKNDNKVESILLIDELDATLHPSFQIKLLILFIEFSEKYKIQIFFTSHSLSLIEEALSSQLENVKQRPCVLYLYDNINNVVAMPDVNIHKIKLYLNNITREAYYKDKYIPILTEDSEARILLKIMFEYFEKEDNDFKKVKNLLYLVNSKIGSENLKTLFSDKKLTAVGLKAICILDGDQSTNDNNTKKKKDGNNKPKDIDNCIIKLPGKKSPEEMLFDYATKLYNDDDSFWTSPEALGDNLGKHCYLKIKDEFNKIEECISQKKLSEEKTTKGIRRTEYKRLFNQNQPFFECLFRHWVTNEDNKSELDKFYKNLQIVFKKVAEYHGICSRDWDK